VQAFLDWDILGALAAEVGRGGHLGVAAASGRKSSLGYDAAASAAAPPPPGGGGVPSAEVPCSYSSFAEYFCCWAPLLLRELRAEMGAEVALRMREGGLPPRHEAMAAVAATASATGGRGAYAPRGLDGGTFDLESVGLKALIVSRRAVATGNANQMPLGTRRPGGSGTLAADASGAGHKGGSGGGSGKTGHLARNDGLRQVISLTELCLSAP
jgi:hypothetical protein